MVMNIRPNTRSSEWDRKKDSNFEQPLESVTIKTH